MQISIVLLIFGFVASYLLLIETQILHLLSKKKNRNRFRYENLGVKLLAIESQPKSKRSKILFIIFSAFLFFTSLALLVLGNLQLSLPIFTFSILILTILKWNFHNIYGLYANGIIWEDAIEWNRLHSWKIEGNQIISIQKTNGTSFSISAPNQIHEISNILREKIGGNG
ncbi:MAG TPA: hypothetical protein DDY13_09540 [Cytophagales bacterium]|jgi:hypothetical protein|nr:hypothetical protein [Cytophagales bacterium]